MKHLINRTCQVSLALVSLLALSGCLNRPIAAVDLDAVGQETVEFRVGQNRNLDILFVIDNSGSMAGEQASLARNFDRLIGQLEALDGGLPSIHIGVVSTDLGAGEFTGECESNDAGVLLSEPQTDDCTGPTDRFIRDYPADGSKRDRNYSGSLQDTFSCIAQVGTSGCKFEQPLEAMRRALDPAQTPENIGFLREDARLAVILITDEDDCSTFDANLFDPDGEDVIGTGSYRCFAHGVTCNERAVDETGRYDDCVPEPNSAFMHDVQAYVEFLRGLKASPDEDLLIASIMGELPAEIVVGTNRQGNLRVQQSCTNDNAPSGSNNTAFPPVRLQAFLDAFRLSQATSICNEDLSDALAQIGTFIATSDEVGCVQGELAGVTVSATRDSVAAVTADELAAIDAVCEVSELRSLDDGEVELLVPACTDVAEPQASAELPCYTAEVNRTACSDTATGLGFRIHYNTSEIVPDDTRIVARCEMK